MRPLRFALAVVSITAGIEAQVPGQSSSSGLGIANIPFVFWGASQMPGGSSGNNNYLNQVQQGWYWNSYALRPFIYYGNGTVTNSMPSPSYANPAAVQPIGELPAPLRAPDKGKRGPEWAEVRSSFDAASAKVSEARRAVEELRARLRAIGQTPRAELTTRASTAEAALKTAQERIDEGDLEESTREIQRSNYIAGQVLKEFGR